MEFWRVPFDSEDIQITTGIVYILEDRCKGCGYCIEFCPRNVLEFSTRFNAKGYHPPAVRKPDECVNCHFCEIICPEFAIYSVEADTDQPVPEEREAA
jgi:2-oxoglutarate ferredoxin oxidoreductase subunit delta